MAKAKTKAVEKNDTHVSYDSVPYTSHPFPQTNPRVLQALGYLFGLTAPAPETARILEIGCAGGNNIMSVASCYPKSTCVGIDYSRKQIEDGQKALAGSGIKNLTLKHMSVMDVDKAFGDFDYIIVHGVMSWVPAEVRAKIIEVCNTNLSPEGIAFVSYNVLPGWNSARSVRDIMLYHTSHFPNPADKVAQARLLLKFLSDCNKNSNSPLATAITREIGIIDGQPDYYILHDHLEENNFAFYFHEFMALATAQDLQYVGDSSIESMFTGNLPPETAKVLSTSGDIVRTEQFMDYLNDRRFRQTLLCHKDCILNRNVNPKLLEKGVLAPRLIYPENFDKIDVHNPEPLEFQSATSLRLTVTDPVIKTLMQVLFENNRRFFSLAELTAMVREKAKANKLDITESEPGNFQDGLATLMLRYLFMGGIFYYAASMPYTREVSKNPTIPALGRYQAATHDWLSNQFQEFKNIAPFDQTLIPLLDGTRDLAALCDAMLPSFKSGKLIIKQGDAVIEDEALIKKFLPDAITTRLTNYAEMGLLSA